jgi:hypothetical protein
MFLWTSQRSLGQSCELPDLKTYMLSATLSIRKAGPTYTIDIVFTTNIGKIVSSTNSALVDRCTVSTGETA